jgi:hypothetical protein
MDYRLIQFPGERVILTRVALSFLYQSFRTFAQFSSLSRVQLGSAFVIFLLTLRYFQRR